MANETTTITLTVTEDGVEFSFPDIENIQNVALATEVLRVSAFVDRDIEDDLFHEVHTKWCVDNDYLEYVGEASND